MIIAELRAWALANGRQDIVAGVPPYTEDKPLYETRVKQFRERARANGQDDLLMAVPECTPQTREAYRTFWLELKVVETELKERAFERTFAARQQMEERLPELVTDLAKVDQDFSNDERINLLEVLATLDPEDLAIDPPQEAASVRVQSYAAAEPHAPSPPRVRAAHPLPVPSPLLYAAGTSRFTGAQMEVEAALQEFMGSPDAPPPSGMRSGRRSLLSPEDATQVLLSNPVGIASKLWVVAERLAERLSGERSSPKARNLRCVRRKCDQVHKLSLVADGSDDPLAEEEEEAEKAEAEEE